MTTEAQRFSITPGPSSALRRQDAGRRRQRCAPVLQRLPDPTSPSCDQCRAFGVPCAHWNASPNAGTQPYMLSHGRRHRAD